jgi:hypothetical protein
MAQRDRPSGAHTDQTSADRRRAAGGPEAGEAPAPGGGRRIRDQRTEPDRRSDASLPNDQGLSSEQARARRGRYGPNAIQEQRQSLLLEIGSTSGARSPG